GVHGAPLGEEELALTKEAYAWEHEPFHIPEEVYETFQQATKSLGEEAERAWNETVASYKEKHADLAKQLEAAIDRKYPVNLRDEMPTYEVGESVATRSASHKAINALAQAVPSLFGGSADLASSNKTTMEGEGNFLPEENFEGRNIWFGVREFAMGTALNGMALHGG